jgi:hypothetical protein
MNCSGGVTHVRALEKKESCCASTTSICPKIDRKRE